MARSRCHLQCDVRCPRTPSHPSSSKNTCGRLTGDWRWCCASLRTAYECTVVRKFSTEARSKMRHWGTGFYLCCLVSFFRFVLPNSLFRLLSVIQCLLHEELISHLPRDRKLKIVSWVMEDCVGSLQALDQKYLIGDNPNNVQELFSSWVWISLMKL